MTGGAERVTHINLPLPSPASAPFLKHTFWYISNHYICLQYILFSVCVDFDEIEKLLGISFAENLANNCFWFSFSPTKSLATSTRVRASVLSLWTYNIMRWFSLESPVVERKWTIWYDTLTKTWSGGLSCLFVVSCLPAFVVDGSKSFSFPDCFFDYTRLCVTSAWFYTHNKSVPCLFSTCLDFFFGGSCEDIIRLSI